jgi:hypothetical protein
VLVLVWWSLVWFFICVWYQYYGTNRYGTIQDLCIVQEGLKKGSRFYDKGMAEPTNSSKECATAEHEVWKIFRLQ